MILNNEESSNQDSNGQIHSAIQKKSIEEMFENNSLVYAIGEDSSLV